MSEKPLADVIIADIDNNVFIFKHPTTDFNTGSQLIVHESQEAVFFMNGQALDSFGAGRHTLTTQNMPYVSKFFNRVTGDTTPFHCEIYFINKTEQMAIKWGTSTKMEYVEPTYGFPIQLGACGEMSLRIANGRKLLIKVVGTETCLTQAQLVEKLRAFLLLRLKNYVVSFIKQEKINIFEIDEHLETISDAVKARLLDDFADYGISLERFLVTTVVKPEDDKNYRRYKDLHFRAYADIAEAKLRQQVGIIEQQTKAQQMVIEAEGLARKRSVEGYNYQQERQLDVAERFAANEATGQLANMGIGMGMISGIGGAVGNSVGGLMTNAMDQMTSPAAVKTLPCSQCGAVIPAASKFCPECGAKCIVPEPEKIICPNCGQSVPQGKFCPECGQKLGNKSCPQCGSEVNGEIKFCPECGTKLA